MFLSMGFEEFPQKFYSEQARNIICYKNIAKDGPNIYDKSE